MQIKYTKYSELPPDLITLFGIKEDHFKKMIIYPYSGKNIQFICKIYPHPTYFTTNLTAGLTDEQARQLGIPEPTEETLFRYEL